VLYFYCSKKSKNPNLLPAKKRNSAVWLPGYFYFNPQKEGYQKCVFYFLANMPNMAHIAHKKFN